MAAVADIKITDNSNEYMRMIFKARDNILDAIGNTAEGYAKEQCPVYTGRLKNSITYATNKRSGFVHSYTDDKNGESFSENVGSVSEEDAVYIGSNVEYAEEQETVEMHHKVGNAHFLRNAATQHTEEYKAITIAGLRSMG